jgi:hypothetical protein
MAGFKLALRPDTTQLSAMLRAAAHRATQLADDFDRIGSGQPEGDADGVATDPARVR